MAVGSDHYELGIVGWPLSRTLSPEIHRDFFRTTDLSGEYSAFPVPPGQLEEDVRRLSEAGVTGLNVTYPHKMDALSLCGELEAVAAAVSSVNTLMISKDGLVGYNTDAHGFRLFAVESGLQPPFYIAGAGGAARAVVHALYTMGCSARVYCRVPGKWRGSSGALDIGSLEEDMASVRTGTLVNATTLGWGDEDEFPVSSGTLAGVTFADLNYNPDWTWRNRLVSLGIRVLTGEEMLVHQAARSFEIWTGRSPDIESAMMIARDRMMRLDEGDQGIED